MTPTTLAILRSVATSDPNLSAGEQVLLQRLISGQVETPASTTTGPLLLSQKEAARLLGISRITLWRMTKSGFVRPVEIAPGNNRYRREDLEAMANGGYVALKRIRKMASIA